MFSEAMERLKVPTVDNGYHHTDLGTVLQPPVCNWNRDRALGELSGLLCGISVGFCYG